MRIFRLGVAVAAALSVFAAAGADASTTVPTRAAPHIGVTLTSSGHAKAGKAMKIRVELTLPHGDALTAYTLDFGDHTKPLRGRKLTATATHTYRRAGRYVVRLVVLDSHHVTRRTSLAETVTGKPLTHTRAATGASATASPSGLPSPPAGCNGTSSPGITAYNTTPAGDGPWLVPSDPCNSEGIGDSNADIYANADYWAAEKRPDIWSAAVLIYGYADAPYGPWNVEEDADRAGYPIGSTPQAGDLAVWNDDATMGTDSTGTVQVAGPGGQAAYVEAVNPDGTVVISEMGAGAEDGGYTYTLTYDPSSAFIHQR